MRAQIALEFSAVFGLLFLAFVAFSAYRISEANIADDAAAVLSAQRTARTLAGVISLSAHTPGASLAFDVPERLEGNRAYNLTVYNASVVVRWENRAVLEQVQTAGTYNASGQSGFSLGPGMYAVNHSAGGVVIAPA